MGLCLLVLYLVNSSHCWYRFEVGCIVFLILKICRVPHHDLWLIYKRIMASCATMPIWVNLLWIPLLHPLLLTFVQYGHVESIKLFADCFWLDLDGCMLLRWWNMYPDCLLHLQHFSFVKVVWRLCLLLLLLHHILLGTALSLSLAFREFLRLSVIIHEFLCILLYRLLILSHHPGGSLPAV